jgi:hypothetical protein
MNGLFSEETLPRTVGELHGFQVEIRCRRCGRVAPIDPEKMVTKGSRAIARSMPLTRFLEALTCAEKACREKPIHLHLKTRIPVGPDREGGPILTWMMDRLGRWQWQGERGEGS